MQPIYCIMFSHSLNDDIRDLLLETAYVLLKSGTKRKKVRSHFCEGIITNVKPIAAYGMNGVQFEAELETEKGDIKVVYMVRPQDLPDLEDEDAEQVAWLSPQEIANLPEGLEKKLRPNPIHRVARKHLEN